MVANHPYIRTDILEIRDVICQKIGDQRAEKYFNHLRRLFSLEVSKIEFDKLCVRTIGRENLSLHNRLIKSLIKNVCLAKIPPPKFRKIEGCLGVGLSNSYQRSDVQSQCSEALAKPPCMIRSIINRDRHYQGGQSPLSLLGRSPDARGEEEVQRVQQQQSATELRSLGSRPLVETASVEDGEEVEQFAGSPGIQTRSPVIPPLGISRNRGGAWKAICSRLGSTCSTRPKTCQNSRELPDTRSLRNHVERKLQLERVGISLDCTNLLNNGLDAFLRRLIEPCIAVAGARCRIEHVTHLNDQNIPGHIHQTVPGVNGISRGRIAKKRIRGECGSMLDFRVAMESNPLLLGEDWPIQLEKICTCAMEE